jgi:hypothetical protein
VKKVIFVWKIMSRTTTPPHIFATGAYMAKETLVQMVTELFNVKAFNHGVFSNVTASQIIGNYSEAARSKNLPPVPASTTVYHTISPNGLGSFTWMISSQPANPLFNKTGHILFNAGSIFRYNWAETRRHLGIVSSLYHVYDSNGQLLATSPSPSPAAIVVLVSTRGRFAWVLVRNGVSANIAPVIASLQRAGYNVTSQQTSTVPPPPASSSSGCSIPASTGNYSTTTPCDIIADTVSCNPKKVVCFDESKDVNPFSTMVTRLGSDCSGSHSNSSSADYYPNQDQAAPFCSSQQCGNNQYNNSNQYNGQYNNSQYNNNQAQQTFASLAAPSTVQAQNVTAPVIQGRQHNNVFDDTIAPTRGPFRNRINEAGIEAEQDVKRAWIDRHPYNYSPEQIQQANTTNQIPPHQVAAATRAINHGAIPPNTNIFANML